MAKTEIFNWLKNRGAVQDVAHEDELAKLLNKPPQTFYCGFDPTAESLHVGSMMPLLIMRRLQDAGHKPIVLLGSATGMIGDPSFKSDERKLLDSATIEKNLKGIEKQVGKFLTKGGTNGFITVDNGDWISKLSAIEFLRDVGKHFSVNAMIAKESVKQRLENREQGISYTEFSYMLLQAYDFYHLNQHHNCTLQIGGSDQWGNITAGTDLIRRKNSEDASSTKNLAYAFTFPLLTMSSGQKFGKTEAGAVWLDPEKTSPYHFYQFWLNTPDQDVIRFIKLFTDIDGAELQELEKSVKEKPEARTAQKKLAEVLTELIHSKSEVSKAENASQVLFGGSIENLDSSTILDIFSNVPSTELEKSKLKTGLTVVDLLVECGVATSKGAARRLVEGGGVYLNNIRSADPAEAVSLNNFLDNKVLVIRSGKKNYFLAQAK